MIAGLSATEMRALAISLSTLVAFRDGQQCVGTVCTTLIKWSDSQFLEFDAKSGNLVAWWIEK